MNSHYLRDVFDPEVYSRTIDCMVHHITEYQKKNRIDAIAFRGLSGSLIAAPVCHLLHLPMICVRKGQEDCHSPYRVEGKFETSNNTLQYVIVDDMIVTGATIKEIVNSVRSEAKELNYGKKKNRLRVSPKAVFLYADVYEMDDITINRKVIPIISFAAAKFDI